MDPSAVKSIVRSQARVALASFLLVSGIASPPPSLADAAATGTVDPQFRSIAEYYRGHWDCNGHFANGKHITSEELFAPWLGGAWLHETHDDHPPYSYRAHSVWGVDAPSHVLTLTIHDNFGGLRLFISHDWSGPSITFEPDPILGHSGRAERFTFVRHPPAAFSFEYEVSVANGKWSLGDHVDCTKGALHGDTPNGL